MKQETITQEEPYAVIGGLSYSRAEIQELKGTILYNTAIRKIRLDNIELFRRKQERLQEIRAFNLAQRENLFNSFDDIAGIIGKIRAGEKVVLGSV